MSSHSRPRRLHARALSIALFPAHAALRALSLQRPAFTLAASVFLLAAFIARGASNPFERIIRDTEPLTPQEELKSFHLPPGFEIQLVASEPEIGKPMNLAFDAQGRLWLTQSREYPFPAPLETKGRDKIMVLSDFGPDGHAGKITAFAEGLNIPIGLYPYKNGVIAYSIPYLHFFQDTTDAGRADKDEIILGRFGFEKDTHGMTSNFRRGYDGWLYADHGFNNNSTLTAKDGSTIKMNSGNTYRVRLDGSHIEQFTWGLVNPFGLMFDPMGDLWASDCETKPDYLLYRGAYYPSFGKPDDGLGFAPQVMNYMHGSTAMAGMIFYDASNFPSEYRGDTLVGNVITSRINRDGFDETGSTRKARAKADFLASDDPWFRPVNLVLGPDGAIYVADFYNRIIGHYEVPLTHPGRDRERGRVWRITYKPGTETRPFDCSKAGLEELWGLLGDPNISVRMLATDEITDRLGAAAIGPLRRKLAGPASVPQKVHGLWALYRVGGMTDELLEKAARDGDHAVRTHAMKALADMSDWVPAERHFALNGLKDRDPWVRRSAADALGRHPRFDQIRPLIAARLAAPAGDEALIHVIRMALRDQLVPEGNFRRVGELSLTEGENAVVADVCRGTHTAESAVWLLGQMKSARMSRAALAEDVRYTARYLPASRADDLGPLVEERFSDDLDFQLTLLKSLREGLAQQGGALTPGMSRWGADLAGRLLGSPSGANSEWRNRALDETAGTKNPWHIETRASADGDRTSVFLSSLPGGEPLTGILRSPNFTIPPRLSFFMAGHNGNPGGNPAPKNFVRLRLADGALVKEEVPPRNDTARRYEWDLQSYAGREGYFEIIDGDTAKAYAWIAVGRWEPPVLRAPALAPAQEVARETAAADLAAALGLTRLAPEMTRLMMNPRADLEARLAMIKALGRLDLRSQVPELSRLLASASEPAAVREEAALALADAPGPEVHASLVEALNTAPQRVQAKIGVALASTKAGAEDFLQAVEAGKASPRLLQEKEILQRLRLAKPDNYQARVEIATRKLPPASEERQKLIDARLRVFDRTKANPEQGARVFEKNCMVCHSLEGKGASIGPQLDGVGGRGPERLMEDVLDPSRNVDKAFRYSTLTLRNDEVISGLQRREEGETLVFADATGKEISVPKKEIKERVESEYSLMPDNLSEIIPAGDFDDLIAFLLTKNARKTP
jgi:putative heme-binding domain-containing protein